MPAADAAPIMIVAGEASGDLHGATLCRALRALAPGAAGCSAWAASAWRRRGWSGSPTSPRAAVIGGTEALGPVPTLYRAWRRLRAALTQAPAGPPRWC